VLFPTRTPSARGVHNTGISRQRIQLILLLF
jgi:hypothetical protein